MNKEKDIKKWKNSFSRKTTQISVNKKKRGNINWIEKIKEGKIKDLLVKKKINYKVRNKYERNEKGEEVYIG